MTKEQIYTQQLKDLGVYEEAYDGEIHMLAVMERELSRAMKAWKATAPANMSPSVLDPHFTTITQLRRDILAHRDALGLTPKALQRLKGKTALEISSGGSTPLSRSLDALVSKVSGYE